MMICDTKRSSYRKLSKQYNVGSFESFRAVKLLYLSCVEIPLYIPISKRVL